LALQLLFAFRAKSSGTGASGARTLHDVEAMKTIGHRWARLRHAHHLIGNPVRHLLVTVVRNVDSELGLNEGEERAITRVRSLRSIARSREARVDGMSAAFWRMRNLSSENDENGN
jgi:hypothetical protein